MRILAVTGSRSDYDLLEPVLRLLEEGRAHELTLFVGCAHLATRWGSTESGIKGFHHVLRRPSLIDWDSPEARLKSMGLQLVALAQDIAEQKPDLVLLLGDREDALLGAMAAQYSWVPVAHIFGGDTGFQTVDDSVRHAVSRLSALHFAASRNSARRLIAMGEEEWRVHFTGNPALDRIRKHKAWTPQQLERRFGIDTTRPAVLVCQHPFRPDPLESERELSCILDALEGQSLEILVNTPNSDPGSSGAFRVLQDRQKVRRLCNLPQEEWVALLRHCALMVGNSSAGLLESAYLGKPAVNVGERQQGREHAGNVEFVSADAKAIRQALSRALHDKKYRSQIHARGCPFGDGHAAERIVAVLDELDPADLLPKRHRDLVSQIGGEDDATAA